jgi:2-oxoglutarate dehydrogenase E1 component
MRADVSLPAVANLEFTEAIYAEYLRNPSSVPAEWQDYFSSLNSVEPGANGNGKFKPGPTFPRRSIFNPPGGKSAAMSDAAEEEMMRLQHRVNRVIRAYRERGHIQAKFNPLGGNDGYVPELDPQYFGFSEADMDKQFVCESMCPHGRLTLRTIISRLREAYCGSIGYQYLHIDDGKMRRWVQKRIEGQTYWEPVSRTRQLRILTRLTDAAIFEQFLRKKFVGAKSFSLEGGESLIPLLDLAIERASRDGVREIVLGMAHRGRLNVLANIIGKSPKQIFREFEDRDPDLYRGGGDVKYHLGYSGDYKISGGKSVHLSLSFNPSHLEFVNPVVMGRVRAKQERIADADGTQVLSLLIHGDAAFIGEGIVQETLNLSRLSGYRVGGTVHILINNQIGFTTPPSEGRSTMYATSVAKMLPAPIFHVNGEDPDAVARCIQLAMDFRVTFKQDVVIDMYCYRRLGHNEGDEPSFTQPQLYSRIEQRKSVRDGYLEHLLKMGEVTQEEADQIAQKQQELLEKNLSEARSSTKGMLPSSLGGIWKGYIGGQEPADDNPKTGLPAKELAPLLEKLCQIPKDFKLHPKLERFMEHRRRMAAGEQSLDWAAAESLALASLTVAGHRIRFSGQDSGRGTFSQRHAVLHDYQTGQTYTSLQHLAENQAPVNIRNSPLSEAGVLGFEYGYSLDCPDGLVVWEAQFGDFVNAAQVILDQFISSGEDKWRRLSGLVLLLPHGFEGSGPEHSSARLERFLTQVAEDNIQVAVPSTPAQYFHLLRRQTLRKWRKPLIVFTPKSLLRDSRCVSSLADCAASQFQRVLPDPRGMPMKNAKRVLLCSGKIYFDLETERAKLKRDDVAIVRIEQLYPFPRTELEKLLADCRDGTPVVWVQEEPENMGAWRYLRATDCLPFIDRLPRLGVCRPASASPATGSHAAHLMEQEKLFKRAFEEEIPASRSNAKTGSAAK